MKTKSKVILAVILVVLLIVGWFVYKQWNSIEAILMSVNTTQEDTVKELEKNKDELQNFLENENNISVRDLTEEESKALQEGKLTEEQILDLLTGEEESSEDENTEAKSPKESNAPAESKSPEKEKQESAKPTKQPEKETSKKPSADETAKPTVAKTPKPQESASESDKKVETLIAKLYVQKSVYLGKLDSIESQARSEYKSLRIGGMEKQAAQQQLVKKYLSQVSSWETTCDGVVNGILAEIKAELSKSGKDTSIVDTMRSAYQEEKKLKKAYFINRYMNQ